LAVQDKKILVRARGEEVVIVHYYKSIVDGVMTSLIDLFFNIRDKYDVSFYILCPEFYSLDHNDFYNKLLDETEFTRNDVHIEYEEFLNDDSNEVTCSIPFLKLNKNFGDPKLFFSVKQAGREEILELGGKITICSARLLYEKMLGGRLNLKFRMGGGSLIILDSLDLYKSKVKAIPTLDIALPKNLKRCYYLSNPANFIKGKKNIEYYHKFSKRRLDTLDGIDYDYRREGKEKIKVGDNSFENIGKGIFENLYHNKTVNYHTDGMTMKDGLYYYLKLFGIDGLKDHAPLEITRQDIEDKLFMKDDDIILELLREIYEN